MNYVNDLPQLVKIPGMEYKVGIDVNYHKNTEYFGFAVFEQDGRGSQRIVQQQVIKNSEHRVDEFAQSIENFYGIKLRPSEDAPYITPDDIMFLESGEEMITTTLSGKQYVSGGDDVEYANEVDDE